MNEFLNQQGIKDKPDENDWMIKLKTYAVALKLVCQDFEDNSEEALGLIEMYLAISKSYLEDPRQENFTSQIFMEMESMRCQIKGDRDE